MSGLAITAGSVFPAAGFGARRGESSAGRDSGARELSEEERRKVDELKKRDVEVRKHEQAHVAAAGRYARGGANYEYTVGPDGKRYATGGNVSIDVSPERTPEATVVKAQVVRRAALAPADPSPQDRRVASAASQLERQARQQIAEARAAEAKGEGAEGSTPLEGQRQPEPGGYGGVKGISPGPQVLDARA